MNPFTAVTVNDVTGDGDGLAVDVRSATAPLASSSSSSSVATSSVSGGAPMVTILDVSMVLHGREEGEKAHWGCAVVHADMRYRLWRLAAAQRRGWQAGVGTVRW